MSKHLIPYYLYIVGTVAFTVYGQIMLKWRIGIYGQLPDSASDKIIFLLKAVLDPYIFSGLVAAFIASLFWMAAMTKFDVSLAYGLQWRTEDPDPGIVAIGNGGKSNSGNLDDGTLNYKKGHLTSNIVRWTGELILQWCNFGLFARGYGF